MLGHGRKAGPVATLAGQQRFWGAELSSVVLCLDPV